MTKYGMESPLASKDIHNKSKQTKLKKYGDENYCNVDKIKQTKLEKYGNENYCNTDKYIQTMISKYGVKSASQLDNYTEKVKKTNLTKFGKEYYSQTDECKQLRHQTNIQKYGNDYTSKFLEKRKKSYKHKTGYEFPLQNPECQYKTFIKGLKKKEYRFPSGEVVLVQGYEPFILDKLLLDGINEADIIVGIKNVPIIKYMDINGILRIHFPDIYLKSKNVLIEVKNEYYAEKNKEFLLYRKRKSEELGFIYQILVYNKKLKTIYEIK